MLLLTLPVLTGKPFWGSETAGRGGGVPIMRDKVSVLHIHIISPIITKLCDEICNCEETMLTCLMWMTC